MGEACAPHWPIECSEETFTQRDFAKQGIASEIEFYSNTWTNGHWYVLEVKEGPFKGLSSIFIANNRKEGAMAVNIGMGLKLFSRTLMAMPALQVTESGCKNWSALLSVNISGNGVQDDFKDNPWSINGNNTSDGDEESHR